MLKLLFFSLFLWVATVFFLPHVAFGDMTFRLAQLLAQAPSDQGAADAPDAANAPNIPQV